MELNDVYKCNVCGNIVELTHVGGGELVCCTKPMVPVKENTTDAATEKHVPVVTETENGIKVVIGEIVHPMEEAHWIEWIEVITKDGKSYKKFLNPGDAPEAEFCISKADVAKVREYCNLHGLWKA